MGVKNNFSQAVSELMGIGKGGDEGEKSMNPAEEAPAATEATEPETLSEAGEQKEESGEAVMASKEKIMAMLSQQPQASSNQTNNGASSIRVSQPQTVTMGTVSNAASNATPNAAPSGVSNSAPKPVQEAEPKPAPGVTTIANGTVIVGEIHAEGDVELLGSVKGKVTSQGDVRVNGKVVGDILGKDIMLEACAVQGNLLASGFVSVDGASVVMGDVKCENFSLDGKIKGNVTVEKEAKFQPQAILSGNVTTASIAMSQGAKIQGAVNIPLGEKEADLPFDVEITI